MLFTLMTEVPPDIEGGGGIVTWGIGAVLFVKLLLRHDSGCPFEPGPPG